VLIKIKHDLARRERIRKILSVGIVVEMLFLTIVGFCMYKNPLNWIETDARKGKFIKWVEFNPTYECLQLAYELDRDSYNTKCQLNWVELLAYSATRGGGTFGNQSKKYISDVAKKIQSGKKMQDITKDMKYYAYYYESYKAVLGGMVGCFEKKEEDGTWKKYYGLKAFSPIGKGFSYCDYDDFGSSRSYGFKREHLGHDMMGLIGTPVIAVESGYIEILGWNQYGGWRIGLRSFDKKRYYYFAHLRQNRPYAKGLKQGDVVTAGDVIGYMGHTGYSAKENVNNINQTHLHFGMELVFDESQKESNNEIWIDCYALCRFLSSHRSEITKEEKTKEWTRTYPMKDPAVDEYKNAQKKGSQE